MRKTLLRLPPLLQYAAAVLRGSPAFHQRHLQQALRSRLGGKSHLQAGGAPPHRLLEAIAGPDTRSTAGSAAQPATASCATHNCRAIWTQRKAFGAAAAAQGSQPSTVNSSSLAGGCQRSAHTRGTDGLGQGEQSTAEQQAELRERSDRLTAAAFAAFLHTNEQGAPLQWTWDRYSFGPRLVKFASAFLLRPSTCWWSRNDC